LVGSGTVLKTGTGTLTIIGNVNLAESVSGDGLFDVQVGKVYASNLPALLNTPAVYGNLQLAAGTTYRDTVASATGTQTALSSLINLPSTVGFAVGQTVSGTGIPAGAKIVSMTSTSITLNVVTTVLANGTVLVQETFGNNTTGDIAGLGTLEKAGLGNLTVSSALSFTGDVVVKAGTLTVGIDGAFDNVNSITLEANTTLAAPRISGAVATLNLNNLSGADSSVINADQAALTFTAAAGATKVYAGQIIGAPTILFNEIRPAGSTASLGTLSLIRPATSANVIGSINVQSGILIGTIAGFGGASLNVAAGAKIGFNNDDTTAAQTYAGAVTGLGTILKNGAGQITLSNGTVTASAYEVLGGKLTVLDTLSNGAANAAINLMNASIATGSTLEVLLNAGRNRNLGAQIQGVSASSQGTLQISNSSTTNSDVYLTAAPALAAINLGNYVRLHQNGQAAIAGVNGSALSVLDFNTGGVVTINQAIDTSFIGIVSGAASQLKFVGLGRASFMNTALATQLGANITLTVGDGTTAGNLELDSRYTSATALTLKGGSLAVNVAAGSPSTFSTTLLGTPGAVKFIKTGLGSLNANAGSVADAIFSAYEVEAGTLLVTPVANQILGGRSVSLKGGNLAIQQDATNPTLGTAGFMTSTSNGTINVLGATSGPTGTLTVTGSFAGGLNLQSGAKVVLGSTGTNPIAISSGVTVGANSTLGGQVVIGTTLANANLVNNGTVSPGYSPGIVTVNGNVTNTGAFIMELSATLANGTYNDQVLFTGTADLNNGGTGSITLKQFGATAPGFGQRFVLFKDTVGANASSFTSLIPASQITSQGISPFRYVLSSPTDASGNVGEFAAYVVRAPSDYDTFKAPASLLASIKSITLVNSVFVNNGADTVLGTADDVYRSTPAASYNAVGAGMAILGDAALQTALNNLTPYGAAGTVTAADTLFQQNIDNAARRLELRRFDRTSLTILSNEWYVDTIGGKATVGASGELQNKATTYGVTAGYTTQVGVDGVAGYALTAQHFSLSSDTATSASGNGFAANAYVGTVAIRGQLSLDAGVSVSHLSSKTTRDSVIGSGNTNVSAPSAMTYGVWGRLGTVIAMKSADSFITPFIGVQYASTKLSSLEESGQADAMSVTSGSISQASVRVGTGFHRMWEEGRGDWRYRLSMDLGYVKQFSGEFGDFTSANSTGINTTYTSSLRVSAGSGFYVSPSLNFGPDENSTFSIGLSYEQGNGNSIGVNAGYRKRF